MQLHVIIQLCEDQGIHVHKKLKNVFATRRLLSLQLMWRPGFRNLMLFFRGRDHTIVSAMTGRARIETRDHGLHACYVPVC